MFSLAHNFDENLFNFIADKNVYEIYGKLSTDVIGGGGPPSSLLGKITRRKVQQSVLKAHQLGISFNYLLNSTCLGNIEYSKKGLKQLTNLLDWLSKIQVDTITISIPFLAYFLKKNYPHFKIDVSIGASVDNLNKFLAWQAMGINAITLDPNINRDFELLKQLKKHATCEIKLLTNMACLPNCISRVYHLNISSHYSKPNNQPQVDFCALTCKSKMLQNPALILGSTWIRPEDLQCYEDLGINRFKLVQRSDTTELLQKTLQAYYSRTYHGNLLDIVRCPAKSDYKGRLALPSLFNILKNYFKPTQINLFKLIQMVQKLHQNQLDIYIDNRKLAKFIDRFLTQSCMGVGCGSCGYCQEWAAKTMTYDKNPQGPNNIQACLDYFLDKENLLFD